MIERSVLTLKDAVLLDKMRRKFKELHKGISEGKMPDEESLLEIENIIERLEEDTSDKIIED